MIERLLTARELAELLGLSASAVLDWFEADRRVAIPPGAWSQRCVISEWLPPRRRHRGRVVLESHLAEVTCARNYNDALKDAAVLDFRHVV